MSNYAEEPLTKVTLNLFTKDLERLRLHYGPGWTKEVRGWVRLRLRLADRISDEKRGVAADD